jgi:virginiamycin B lyase
MENRTQRLLLAAIVLSAAAVAAAAPAAAQTITEFPTPRVDSGPIGITAGPDGALWFTENGGNEIGRITIAGVFTEFPLPTAGSGPAGITTGPDGALWFTENLGNNIGRITTAGVITEFAIPTATSYPVGIATGPDGALWFTESGGNKIGRITTVGVLSEIPLPTAGSVPENITTGPDGMLWFTEAGAIKIGRITTAGAITEFRIPNQSSACCQPIGITAGPDGALWFTEINDCNCNNDSAIGRITTSGVFSLFSFPSTVDSQPYRITTGPDGALWFTEYTGDNIGRITIAGVMTEFSIPTGLSSPFGITTGPDGALWFTESNQHLGKIGRLTLPFHTDDLTATPTSGPAPLAVTFTASGLALPMTYTINFGDGTTGALSQGNCIGVTAIVGGQGGIQCSGSASHIYTAAGSYSASLLNALGLTVGTVTITVTGAAPKVSFTATSPSTLRAGIGYNRIDPSGGIAPPNQATTLGSPTIPAMQDVPRQTLEAPFAGSNATVPSISSFTASPASISPFAGGGSATLTWSVASATSLSISGLGAVIGNSIQVSPSQTTTYTLTASNAQGAVTAQTSVIVAGYRSRRADPLSR